MKRTANPPRSQAAEIHLVLRDRICLLRYRPGELLGETELAEEFGVSRTPVRQALQRLDYEGLVETKNGVGTMVTGLNSVQFKDIYALRLRLSEMIGDFGAVDLCPKALAEVEGLRPRVNELVGSRDFEQFWQINHELHFAINALIGNAAMREVHDRLYFLAARIWYSFVDRMWEDEVTFLSEELNELSRALQANDIRAVGFVQRNYISYGLARVAAYMPISQ